MAILKIKLRTLLLSVFLGTILVSSTLIISFTYAKYAKSIHELSLKMIDSAGSKIYETVSCLLHEMESLPSLGFLFVNKYPEIDFKNTTLTNFFLGILKHDPNLLSYYVGFPDGSYLIANHVAYATKGPLFENMPKEASYILLLMDRSKSNGVQTWAYYKNDFSLIETRNLPADYDPRSRPWYTGAVSNRTLFWTDPYHHYHRQGELGLSVAQPFYDPSGQLFCVIGADLAFNLFSNLLQEELLSQHGKALILDPNGTVIFPREIDPGEQEIASAAFAESKTFKSHDFSYRFKRDDYLASLYPFPTSYNKHWSIVFIAPLSDFFADVIQAQHTAIFLSLGILLAASLLVVILSIHVSKPIVQIAQEIDRITHLELESEQRIFSHIEELGRIDASVASMRVALRSFAHYVPKEIAKQLMRKEHEIALGGEKKTIAIFFTDITDFTSIAETLPIEKVNQMLTEYFEILTNVILQCGGTIDKYMGDSVMSIWGAPEELPRLEARACTAALLCQRRLSEFHIKCKEAGLPALITRMGIKTGPVIVGNFGTLERMNYSAIGDAVNTAARLQALNKIYRTHILVGEETIKAAGPEYVARPIEVVEIRGKKIRIKVYELLAKKGDRPEIMPTSDQTELCAQFTRAFETFEKGNLKEAKRLFEKIHEKFPEDYPTLHYLQKLKNL